MTDAKWNALSPEAKSNLIEKQKDEKATNLTAAGMTAKSLEDKKTMMIVPWDLLKVWQIYRRTMKDLSDN